jgi:cytochrome P450
MARTTNEDVELAGSVVKAGSHLAMSIPSLHNNPDVWPEPERFDPDRFLPEAVAKRSPNAYVPFGRGPHACIGSHFSVQELLVMTAVLCARFRVKMDEPETFDPHDVRAGLSVYPRSGIQMRVERRARLREEAAQ